MTEKPKHIDEIYRDKLLRAEIDPPASAWDKLENDLDARSKNRRIILYRRWTAVAASVVVIMSLSIVYLIERNSYYKKELSEQVQTGSKSGNTHLKTHKNNKNLAKLKSNEVILPDNNPPKGKLLLEKPSGFYSGNPVANSLSSDDSPSTSRSKPIHPIYAEITEVIIGNSYKKPEIEPKIRIASPVFKDSLPIWNMLLDEPNRFMAANIQHENKKKKRWSIGADFSPTFVNRSSRRSDYATDSKAYDVNDYAAQNTHIQPQRERNTSAYTSGINVNYHISSKWSFQSGVYYSKQGREIENFAVLESNTLGINNYSSNSSSGNIEIADVAFLVENAKLADATALEGTSNVSYFNSDLIQNFEFIEIPLIAMCRLINRKISMSVLAGLNAGFLIQNDVFLKGIDNSIGKTEDLNSMIYKSIFGLAFEYPLKGKLFFNFSPMLKYQLNPMNKNDANNLRIRYFDFKTGISYHF